MNNRPMPTPEPLRLADWLQSRAESIEQINAAALLRTQHAAIERKDALLRQALEVFTINIEGSSLMDYINARNAVVQAITKELQ